MESNGKVLKLRINGERIFLVEENNKKKTKRLTPSLSIRRDS